MQAPIQSISFPIANKKRVREEGDGFGDLQPYEVKRQKKPDDRVDVPWVDNWPEFNADLVRIGKYVSFEERIQAFKEYLAQTHINAWQMWLLSDELVLTEEPYDSNALSEAGFLELAGETNNDRLYYRLRLEDGKEVDSTAKPLLDVLISPEGGAAQLMWVQASQHGGLKGLEVLSLFLRLVDHLGCQKSYALDDAHDANGIVLRKMGAMTDERGRTLYVKYGGFRALTCAGIVGVVDDDSKVAHVWDQRAADYANALKTLRATKLCDLYAMAKKRSQKAKQLVRDVKERYLPNEKENRVKTCQITQSDVLAKVYEKFRKGVNRDEKKQAARTLKLWQETLLTWYSQSGRLSCKERTYWNAVDILECTQMFYRVRPSLPTAE